MDQDLIARHVIRANEPMQWGLDDCALWVADLLLEQTGDDLMAEWRGLYHSEAEAVALMNERGGDLVVNAMRAARAAGWRRGEPAELKRPSLGLFAQQLPEMDVAVYVCCALVAPGWFMSRAETGVSSVPASLVRRAWACPRP